MILSGMSSFAQMQDNLATFASSRPLNENETAALMEIAEGLKNAVPCTACRYCCDGCPQGLDIPMLLALYNDYRFATNFTVTMAVEALPADKAPSACIACGKCAKVCPQNIDIPNAMRDFADRIAQNPSWAEICRERAEAQKKNK